ncbi:hypothetical protein [Pseudomonas helvetica]|uniref:hypothetical protein n=1 Tax=Pseudomonas helvetica TaxID=3136738 RepID=UPI0032656D89
MRKTKADIAAATISSETKHNLLSQTILNYVTVLGIVIGGIWIAFNVIYVKQEQEIASYTLRELKQKTSLAPHVRSKVTATVSPKSDAPSTVQVRVELSNQGTAASRVILDNFALSVTGIAFKEGIPLYLTEVPVGSTRFKGNFRQVGDFIDIGAGETYDISYIFQLSAPGTYLIRFLANMDSPYLKEYKQKVGTPAYSEYSTGDDTYISIQQF